MSLKRIQGEREWEKMKEELDKDVQASYLVICICIVVILLLIFVLEKTKEVCL